MATILIIEDDSALRSGIALALESRERQTITCPDLAHARQTLSTLTPDLILLDINLPDGNGLDFCREIRSYSHIPVIFLTANDTELDEVMGLEAGGDDYITKPFSMAVLRARVDAALRRSAETPTQAPLCIRDLELDFQNLRFRKGGREVSLSRTEQRLLQLLVENRGRTLPRERLLEQVWDGGEFVDENALSVAIRRLRGKLEEDPKNPQFIQTVYGIGYTWTVK